MEAGGKVGQASSLSVLSQEKVKPDRLEACPTKYADESKLSRGHERPPVSPPRSRHLPEYRFPIPP